MVLTHPRNETNSQRLKVYLFFRITFVFIISLLAIFLYFKGKWPYPSSYFIYFLEWTGVVFFTSFLSWLFWYKKEYRILSSFLLSLDPFLITALIYITGGANSFFSILYIFVIILAAQIFQKRGAFLMAALSCILYGGLIDLQYFGIITPLGEKAGEDVFFTLLINFSAFFTIAFLISLLLEQLEKSRKKIHFLELLHKHVLESIPSGVITVNEKDRILYMNKTAEFLTGYQSQFLLHQPLKKVFPYQKLIPGQRMEFSFVKPDGKVVYLGISVSSLRNETGEYVGKVVIFQDLTHIKQAEKLSLLNKLTSHMAHEIRTPLTSISGCLQMLRKEDNISFQSKTLIELSLQEIKRLNSLISDYLTFARPVWQKEKVNLAKLIEETVALFKGGLENKKIFIETKLLPEIYILGNKEEIRRIFWNLFVNAYEAMPEGGKLIISMENSSFNMVKVDVEDTGKGIPADMKDRIFEPFFTTKAHGSGLGLAIVHKIVSEHEGKIEVKSELNKGTTFTLYFPLTSPPHSKHEP
ncbi:MAG: ATP-binding protein [Candidatus Desulfofervidus auxilii]|nr:ATP-binding protein [Candidatus Desulfofervidus auxilii]